MATVIIRPAFERDEALPITARLGSIAPTIAVLAPAGAASAGGVAPTVRVERKARRIDAKLWITLLAALVTTTANADDAVENVRWVVQRLLERLTE